MFTLTQDAISAIRELTARTDMSGHGGLRITCTAIADGANEFIASVARGPEPHDEVVDMDGARVYLDPRAVPLVKDMVLDAEAAGDGHVRFALTQRTSKLPG